jgi:hypothetical protein
MTSQSNEKILSTFRQELFEEGILHEGDSIGTDDETLLQVIHLLLFWQDLHYSNKQGDSSEPVNLT